MPYSQWFEQEMSKAEEDAALDRWVESQKSAQGCEIDPCALGSEDFEQEEAYYASLLGKGRVVA